MKNSTVIVVAGALILAAAIAVSVRRIAPIGQPPPQRPAKPDIAVARPKAAAEATASARPSGLTPPQTAEEKAARIAKIKRDYDEIRNKASAEYSAAGAAFPGGLNAFLKQLALLERERRADYAKVLAPRELEELEMSETSAGNLVERLLGPTHATVEQRRTVFQLQRTFEDQFALSYDITPKALFERESARQRTQEQIRAVLGDDLFGSWLYGEGEDYALWVAFAAKHTLPDSVPLDLWRVKNEYTRRRLELAAQKLPAESQRAAQTALALEIESRVLQIVGPSVLQSGRGNVLGWLPKR